MKEAENKDSVAAPDDREPRVREKDSKLELLDRREARREELSETIADGLTLDELVVMARRALGFLRRNLWHLLIPAVLGGVLGACFALFVPPAASASFEVRLVPKVAENPVASYERSNVEYFQAAEQSFGSLPLISESLTSLGEKDPAPSRVDEVKRKLVFYPIAHRTYFGRYTGETPELALRFLKTHVQRYLDHEIDKTLAVIQAEVQFLEAQLEGVREELRRSELALRKFKEENADGLPAQAKEHYLLLRGLEQLRRELHGTMQRLQLELDLNKSKLKGEKLFVESKVISTQRAQPYQDAIIEINQKIALAQASRMKEEHPEMQRLRRLAQILEELSKSTKMDSKTEIEKRRNPIFESIQDAVYHLEVQLAVARSQYDTATQQLEHARSVVAKLPALEAEYSELTRAHSTNMGLFEQILKQLKVTKLQLDLERATQVARYDIVTPPHLDVVSPTKLLVLRTLMLGIAGICLGFAAAVVRELRAYVQ